MYGFVGDFELRRVLRVRPGPVYQPSDLNFIDRYRQRRREKRGACSHLVWEFEARK
jgi:hypothetical protein